ncbi:hypothetical protein KRX19_05750 [Cardiobacteriaceae bacterium TAE3-ERU3]|nr:hypothetical protein [Cardiobacteriaceae bacterium TAE3-ERU3]
MKDLIIRVHTEIADTNIEPFRAQAEKYLADINTELQTDEDFAQAEQDCKDLKELESKTRTTIEEVVNGNADVEKIIASAKAIAEQFRTTRLALEKLVKSEKERRKQDIINEAVKKVQAAYGLVKEIRPMLAITTPMADLVKRIEEAAKNKRSIDGIEKGVNTEATNIAAELSQEIGRLKDRYKQIPEDKAYLFRDLDTLVAGNEDIAAVVAQRIADEEQRIADEKARIEAEAKAKAEAELAARQEAKKAQQKTAPEQPKEEPVKREEPTPQADAQDVPDIDVGEMGTLKITAICDIETAKKIAEIVKQHHSDVRVTWKKGE